MYRNELNATREEENREHLVANVHACKYTMTCSDDMQIKCCLKCVCMFMLC